MRLGLSPKARAGVGHLAMIPGNNCIHDMLKIVRCRVMGFTAASMSGDVSNERMMVFFSLISC